MSKVVKRSHRRMHGQCERCRGMGQVLWARRPKKTVHGRKCFRLLCIRCDTVTGMQR